MQEISGAQQTGGFEEKYLESCSDHAFVGSKASSSSYILHGSVDATRRSTALCRSKVQSTQSSVASSPGISRKSVHMSKWLILIKSLANVYACLDQITVGSLHVNSEVGVQSD